MAKLFNVILVETHNACNRTCWFCKFGQERQDESTARMSWEIIEKIVSNLKQLNYRDRISWFHINEPLADKRIFEILKLTRRECPEAYLTLNTNGDLLDEDSYRRLRESGLNALGVSVYDTEVYSKVKAIKADGRLIILDKRHPQTKLENRGGSIKSDDSRFEEDRVRHAGSNCRRPSNMLVINAKGKAVLCCADMYGDVPMGDVHRENLEEIWFNEKFRNYRTTLSKQGRVGLKLCEGCSHGGATSSIGYPVRKPDFSRAKFLNPEIARSE